MKKLVAVVVFTLAASPLVLAQDKARDAEKKAPVAAEKSEKKGAEREAEDASGAHERVRRQGRGA